MRLPGNTKNRQRSAFTLIESVLCLAVFSALLIVFSAAFPHILRAGDKSAAASQAVLIAQHKLDQLRQLGYGQLRDRALLQQMGVIDPQLNADGTYAFAQVDGLVDSGARKGFFGAAGNVATRIEVGQALPELGASAPSTLRALGVTVTIQWRASTQRISECTLHTIVAAP